MYMYMYIYITRVHIHIFNDIMHGHGHNNIRNGIVWVQTGHGTSTCTATLCVIEPRTHQKIRIVQK